MTDAGESEQLALVPGPVSARRRAKPASSAEPVAERLPVARVAVDIALPHLDRPFDYLVPASMDADAIPGARVSVRFAGADHDGFVIARLDESDHDGRLARLRRVISVEPVLTPDVLVVARAVADRYAGTLSDVLRLAIPARHARTEAKPSEPAPMPPPAPEPAGWADHVHGTALVQALARGDAPRAVWTAGPGADWPDLIARAVVATLSAGRGALVVVPDGRDLARVDAALTALAGPAHHVVLEAEAGPAERYRRWLAVRRGAVRAVVGTRAAAFAPVADLGLVVVWDDGDDLHAEQRAPYPHVREVLLLRAHQAGCAAVVGGHARTAEAALLLESGWAQPVEASRQVVRTGAPRIVVSGDDHEQARDEAARSARLPSLAWRAARSGLERGPVLVQVPRAGYLPAVACARCRGPARCTHCSGPLQLGRGGAEPTCGWCGTSAPGWSCPECGHQTVRAVAVGVRRTAEELGRAFPGTTVVVSRGDSVHDQVGDDSVLVVATPGAEPVPAAGYAAAVLLDTTAVLTRPGLRTTEEALRRWLRAAVLVRPAGDGGEVVVVGESSVPAIQALVRWDPGGFAAREVRERSELRFPPAVRVAECRGAVADVAELIDLVELPPDTEVLGPIDGPDATARVILRVDRANGTALAAALRAAAGVRSARRSGGPVRVCVDPVDLG